MSHNMLLGPNIKIFARGALTKYANTHIFSDRNCKSRVHNIISVRRTVLGQVASTENFSVLSVPAKGLCFLPLRFFISYGSKRNMTGFIFYSGHGIAFSQLRHAANSRLIRGNKFFHNFASTGAWRKYRFLQPLLLGPISATTRATYSTPATCT